MRPLIDPITINPWFDLTKRKKLPKGNLTVRFEEEEIIIPAEIYALMVKRFILYDNNRISLRKGKSLVK